MSTLAGSFAQAALFAYIASAPFVFMGLFHFSPREFALLFGVNASGFIGASQLNRWLLARFNVRGIARSGSAGPMASTMALSASAALASMFALRREAQPQLAAADEWRPLAARRAIGHHQQLHARRIRSAGSQGRGVHARRVRSWTRGHGLPPRLLELL